MGSTVANYYFVEETVNNGNLSNVCYMMSSIDCMLSNGIRNLKYYISESEYLLALGDFL